MTIVVDAEIVDNNEGTIGGEGQRMSPPQTATGASDHRHTSAQLSGHSDTLVTTSLPQRGRSSVEDPGDLHHDVTTARDIPRQ